MGDFFAVQGGGGQYPLAPSPATNRSVVRFLSERAGLPDAALSKVAEMSVADGVGSLTALQGCRLWHHPSWLEEVELSKEQGDLVGSGIAGPPTSGSPEEGTWSSGYDLRQLRMLKAQVHPARIS
jgi:hypothetical protein